ncbi:MAG: hypothetical protein V3W14_06835 [Candidatus Neomarinimicrobiota bacterium]
MAASEASKEEFWRAIFVEGQEELNGLKKLMRYLPGNPRCKLCNAPLKGPGGLIMRLRGRRPSPMNPSMCSP